MIEIGSVIRARVVRVETYGVFLAYGEEDIFVVLPEISWHRIQDLRKALTVGEHLDILVVGYNYRNKQIIGSVRLLHPEQNPYRDLSRLEPETVLHGKVVFLDSVSVRVELENSARGNIPKNQLEIELKVGDSVDVKIASLWVDQGILELELIRKT